MPPLAGLDGKRAPLIPQAGTVVAVDAVHAVDAVAVDSRLADS
jgi:hypothetical protein